MVLPILLMAALQVKEHQPVLWLKPTGQIEIAGREVNPRFTPGADRIRIPGAVGFSFTGEHGGILFDDVPALRLTGSMTISVWLYLRSYVSTGPGAQVLIRGDDRNGLDPYDLVIHPEGTIFFGITNSGNKSAGVSGPINLNRWTHVVSSFDARLGQLVMWIDHDQVGLADTEVKPLEALDKNYAPGVGIGNVQNDRGPHNQPLNGVIADLRVYDSPLEPDMIDHGVPSWVNVPPAR